MILFNTNPFINAMKTTREFINSTSFYYLRLLLCY